MLAIYEYLKVKDINTEIALKDLAAEPKLLGPYDILTICGPLNYGSAAIKD